MNQLYSETGMRATLGTPSYSLLFPCVTPLQDLHPALLNLLCVPLSLPAFIHEAAGKQT